MTKLRPLVIDPKHPLGTEDGITLFVTLLAYQGSLCPKCGFGTRVTSKRWAKCKKCDTRVERHSLDDLTPSKNTSQEK